MKILLHLRKYLILNGISILIFCIFILPFFLASSVETAQLYRAKVERVIDGDTILVRLNGESIKVRLWGIDTPEYHQAYSKVAKRLTKRLAGKSNVQLQVMDWDDYGRMVAIVILADDRLLNEVLVKNGLAWVHIYYCKEPICNKWYGFEKRARTNRLGLWQDRSPVPPWEWKRINKR